MDKKKNRIRRYVALCGASIFVLTLLFFWKQYNEESVKAAAGIITINDDSKSGTFYLKKPNLPAFIEDIQTGTVVTWSTSDTGVFRINNQTTTTVSGTNMSNVTLQAIGIGTATLSVTYVDKDGVNQNLARIINVPSAITEDAAYFGPLNAVVESAMILELSGARSSGTLSLLYSVSSSINVRWTSDNPYVVSMDASGYVASNSTGYFRATGTGKTTITVSYTDDGQLVTSSVVVYVAPKVSVAAAEVTTASVEKGDYIDLGANMINNNGTISDKVIWFLTDENGNIIEQSTTANKKYLSSSPYSSQLEVTGTAGKYILYVFTAGTYNTGDNLSSNGISSYLKRTVELKILPEPRSNNSNPVSLQVGDSYNVAEIFNMSVADFNKYFDYGTSGLGTFSNGVFTAENTGPATLTIKAKDGMAAEFATFLGSTPSFPYTIAVNIYRGFTLDRSEASIYVGGSLRLNTVYGANKGTITWKSSDKASVTVVGSDTSAIITGVKSTGDSTVTITASMTLADGRTLTATCQVKVSTTANKIKLSETNLIMRIGATATVTASYEPTTTTSVNLQWLLTDDSIVEMSKGSDKSVVLTAKKAGTTTLTAVNADNYIAAYCTVTVSSAIETITLNYTQVTMTMSQEVLKLRATYTPADATQTELIWTSSDKSVATVDDGLVTFKGPGNTIITVQPKWNEKMVMAQCNLTVIASPTMFSLDQTAITIETGETKTLKPVLTAANSTTTYTWKSINPAVATVSNSGVVTGVSAGQAYIVVTTKEGLVANCQVTVTQKANGITLSNYNIKLGVGEKMTVTAIPVPATSSETKFTWSSKDSKIATVSDGVVTGVSGGSTIITVKTKTGDSAILYVSVYDKATGMTLNYSNKELAKGATFKLKPIFTPQNVSNTKITWKSLNPTIASVSTSGVVAGLKGGAAVITAVSDDGGYLSTCLVTVVQPVTSIKLNYSSYKLGIGKSIALKAAVTSNSASNAKVKWSTSNSRIATVSSTGVVKGKKLGSCTITAKATDGSGKKVSCKIRVVRSVSSISLNKSVLTVVASKTATLKATVRPSNATYKTVTWTTSNSSVAVVDSKGHVTGLAVGSCTVKATAKDSSKKAAICYVNVINPIPASSIILSARDLVMIKGQSQILSYTVTPSNHTDKISFSSDNKSVATITGTGRIYARRTGAATISVTSASGKQATVSVTVIGLNKTLLSLEQYDTETLTVDGAGSGVTWYSDNPSVATVSGGKVVARKAGTTTVRARVNGVILSCTVRVKGIS